MRLKKLEKYIERKVKEECINLEEKAAWVLLRTLESDMQYVRPAVEELKGTVNSIWGLPMFKPYRGKK